MGGAEDVSGGVCVEQAGAESTSLLATKPTTRPATKQSTVPLEEAVHSVVVEDVLRAAGDAALTAELALAMLRRADLSGSVIEELARNRSLLNLRKVKIAVASHPQAPRHVSVPLVRQFYTFDLMKVALSAVVPADVKRTRGRSFDWAAQDGLGG